MMLTKNQIAILHVAKKQLAMDNDTYRDVLRAHGGAGSARDLDYDGFRAVMRHFEASGFVSRPKEKKGGPSAGDIPRGRPGMASRAQIKKIYAMWWGLGGSYYTPGKEFAALRSFLKKRFRVHHENFLTKEKAHGVIEALKNIGTKAGGSASEEIRGAGA